MIKCLLTELAWAGWENIWPNIFPSGRLTQSISTYYALMSRILFAAKHSWTV